MILDVEPVLVMLADKMKGNLPALRADTRWAGEAWNSASGLLEPLLNQAKAMPEYRPSPALERIIAMLASEIDGK